MSMSKKSIKSPVPPSTPEDNLKGKRLLSIDEAARYLGCSPKTLYNRRYKRDLPFPVKLGMGRALRFDINDLKAYCDDLPADTYDPPDKAA